VRTVRTVRTRNRQIAAKIGVSDNTVGSVRQELESTAQIAQLNSTTGKDGKSRPAKKKGRRRGSYAKKVGQEAAAAAAAYANGDPLANGEHDPAEPPAQHVGRL
jgi:hypothetical protein